MFKKEILIDCMFDLVINVQQAPVVNLKNDVEQIIY